MRTLISLIGVGIRMSLLNGLAETAVKMVRSTQSIRVAS
jgi:hypothetical protein